MLALLCLAAVLMAPAQEGLIGTVLAADTSDLAFETRGRLVEVSVRPGDRVQPGMPLAAIEPVDLREQLVSAETAMQTARSGLSKAQAALRDARQRPAEKEKLEASEKELETARARLLEAEAELRRLRGQSYRQVLRARSEGWVAARLLEPGATVEAGQPVVRLRSGDRYLLRFGVPPAEAAQWAGKKIRWRPEGSESFYPAVVARVAAQVDPQFQTVFVEADLEPSPLLEDGLVVRVEPLE